MHHLTDDKHIHQGCIRMERHDGMQDCRKGGDHITMEIARLGPEQRAQAMRQMAERTFDVVVVGGGVTGTGTALDAASRGLTVALLEAGDLASGTSSRSGKTFHGGLRYLQQLNFPLVRQ